MTGNFTEPEPWQPNQSVRMVITVIFGSLLLIGIVGNVLVITLILLVKTMRSAVNLCLASLALTDLIVLVFLPIKSIANLHGIYEPFFGTKLCVYVRSLDTSAFVCSVLTFLLIGVERYTVVCHPLKIRGFWTCTKFFLVLAGIWAVAAGTSVPFSLVTRYQWSQAGNITSYTCNVGKVVPWVAIYDTVLLFICMFLPIPFLVFLYGKVIITLRTEVPESDGQGNGARKIRKSRSKVIKVVVVIVVIFIGSCLPFYAIFLVDLFANSFQFWGAKLTFQLVWSSYFLLYINFIANPIVYLAMSDNFRQAFILLFWRRGKPSISKIMRSQYSEAPVNICVNL